MKEEKSIEFSFADLFVGQAQNAAEAHERARRHNGRVKQDWYCVLVYPFDIPRGMERRTTPEDVIAGYKCVKRNGEWVVEDYHSNK